MVFGWKRGRPSLNRLEKSSTPSPKSLEKMRTVIDTHFNENIRLMKSTTSVHSRVPVLNYLITACYACIITYKGLGMLVKYIFYTRLHAIQCAH